MSIIWHLTMILSTAGLSLLGVVSKDNSVMPFVALGVAALFLTTLEGAVKSALALRKINKKHEHLKRLKAQHLTNPPKTEAEKREELRAKILAENEFSKRQSSSAPGNSAFSS